MIEYGLAERRAAGASGDRTRRPAPPTRRHDAQLAEDGARRALRVTEPQIASWQEQLAALAWTPRCLRPEHRRLWNPVTLRHLGIGWDDHRLTIPIRDIDGHLRGLLRYAPMATRTAKMIATPGTRLGLIPHPAAEPSRWIVLAEGPPDMISARACGMPALAVPGDQAWDSAWGPQLRGP